MRYPWYGTVVLRSLERVVNIYVVVELAPLRLRCVLDKICTADHERSSLRRYEDIFTDVNRLCARVERVAEYI